MTYSRFYPALLAICFCLTGYQAIAFDERITDFTSYVTVRPDASLLVTEMITVNASGNKIKHGIYRDFPTSYKDKLGNRINVGFRVKDVLRDNVEIPYTIKTLSNGRRIYMGDAHIPIEPGSYTFTFTYEVTDELGFFSNYDELYWNVTGNGWMFPIDQATCTITLPVGANILQQSGYTGFNGENGQDYNFHQSADGKEIFTTTRTLDRNEGLTVAVAWPKGFVIPPSAFDRLMALPYTNPALALSGSAFLLQLLYLLLVWRRVKASEPLETVIPLFTPPKDLPVPAVSFIYHEGFDNKTLPSTIVDLAVKGYLTISQEKEFLGSQYSITKTANAKALALPEIEKITGNYLFGEGDTLTLNQNNYLPLQTARNMLNAGLKAAFREGYFSDNYGYLWIGFAFGIVAAVAACALPHVMIEPLLVGVIFATVFLPIVFIRPIKSYTKEGKDVATQIEGFKLFLSVTEKERFNMMNPPDVTPELFEKYFPYAVALGVENKWGDKFSKYLAAAGQNIHDYQPKWYAGYNRNDGLQQLSSGLGASFASAIASSSMPPGSVSGSGGGGFSGGGGGGGGGGGF